MLGNIFGSKKPKETWSDRTKAHRAALRADKEGESGSSRSASSDSPRAERREKPARTGKSGGQGFGKRGAD